MIPQSAIKAESQALPPLNAGKRVADFPTFPQEQRQRSSSASEIHGGSQRATQEMHRKTSLTTTIGRKLIIDTIQYLQTISDRILISDTIPCTEWATMHLAMQFLQSRYEDIIAGEEMESNAVSESTFPPTQPEEKCRKCTAADEEKLYD